MNKPNTFPRVEAELGMIAQLDVLSKSLVRLLELGAQYVYSETTGVSGIQKEVLDMPVVRWQEARNKRSRRDGTQMYMCVEK